MSNVLANIISSKSSCLIIPHQSPDGDCLGSSYTLSNFLDRHQIKHHIIMDDVIPTNYLFLQKDNMIKSEDITDDQTFEYAIILDTSSLDRVGASSAVLDKCHKKIVIDHHKTNSFFGDFNVVEMVSSVGELLYNLYQELNYKIDLEDAKGLYTSIVTDTGEFRYSNTSSETLMIVSKLFDTGFDFESISREIFSNQEIQQVILKSTCLANLELHKDNKIVLMYVSQDMLKETNSQMFHSDGIVESGRDISGVEVSILLKEMDENTVKVSMRSKSYLDVAQISLLFDGGGHARAAGCTIKLPLNEAKLKILKEIERLI